MLSRLVWVLLVLGTGGVAWACPDTEMPREVALALFKDRVLGRMGLKAPPVAPEFSPGLKGPRRRPRRSSSAAGADKDHEQDLDISQIILFPSSDSACGRAEGSDGKMATFHSYHFQPSVNHRELLITSARFWFYAGPASNSSAPLHILTPGGRSDRLAEAPSATSADGWATYDLDRRRRPAALHPGPFTLRVRRGGCPRLADDPGKTPFLHLRARPRGSGRRPRRAVPWSRAAVDLLQRPSRRRPEPGGDCRRDEVDVSFDELGWGSWIVHPKVVTFGYCHGNCSAPERSAALLGIRQCCAPVPESMRSLRITTTSDGGYSFKYETLPNIIPEECSCV